jgi:hypothetical protein
MSYFQDPLPYNIYYFMLNIQCTFTSKQLCTSLKGTHSISEWTATRESDINIDRYSCFLLRAQCQNCLTANEKGHETVVTSCAPTSTHATHRQHVRRNSPCNARRVLSDLTRIFQPRGSIPNFAYKPMCNCKAMN